MNLKSASYWAPIPRKNDEACDLFHDPFKKGLELVLYVEGIAEGGAYFAPMSEEDPPRIRIEQKDETKGGKKGKIVKVIAPNDVWGKSKKSLETDHLYLPWQ